VLPLIVELRKVRRIGYELGVDGRAIDRQFPPVALQRIGFEDIELLQRFCVAERDLRHILDRRLVLRLQILDLLRSQPVVRLDGVFVFARVVLPIEELFGVRHLSK